MQSRKFSKTLKKLVLDISYRAQVGHIGSALSIADILSVLYLDVLKLFPSTPHHPQRDRFILSKGHAVVALYSALYLKGFFSQKTLKKYCQDGSLLGEHPEYGVPGVELSTGSLGHGLSVGSGMAMAAKLDHSIYKTFVLISDAELNEGQVWEAAAFASHHQLDNLTAVIDNNKVQAFGSTRDVLNMEPVKDKWRAFGWEVDEVNGHDLKELQRIFHQPQKRLKPKAVIAHTIRGKGISFMEHVIDWHYLTLNKTQYQQAIKEINNL